MSLLSQNTEYLSILSSYIIIPIILTMKSEAIWLKQSEFLDIISITYGKGQQIKVHGPNSACNLFLYDPGTKNNFYIFKGLFKKQLCSDRDFIQPTEPNIFIIWPIKRLLIILFLLM